MKKVTKVFIAGCFFFNFITASDLTRLEREIESLEKKIALKETKVAVLETQQGRIEERIGFCKEKIEHLERSLFPDGSDEMATPISASEGAISLSKQETEQWESTNVLLRTFLRQRVCVQQIMEVHLQGILELEQLALRATERLVAENLKSKQ